MSRPPIPQNRIPDGATHALYSNAIGWYFWKVTPNGTTYHDINGTGTWRCHTNQETSDFKLYRYLQSGKAVVLGSKPPQPEEESPEMNLDNAALLIRDDLRTAKATDSNNKQHTIIVHFSLNVLKGDTLLVPRNDMVGNAACMRVDSVDETPDINPNSNRVYYWAIANVTEAYDAMDKHRKITDQIAAKLKVQQAGNIREQILRQFGVASMQELLNGPQKPDHEEKSSGTESGSD